MAAPRVAVLWLMRVLTSIAWTLLVSTLPLGAAAQEETPSGALDPESYVALSADQDAQTSLGGFRRYLERVRADDRALYTLLDDRLDPLEERNTVADVVFWTGAALSVGALVAAIPAHETLGLDASLAFVAAGASAFLLTVIIQAALRPGHDDLMALIDLHDQRLGRR